MGEHQETMRRRVRNGPSTRQPSAAKDVVAKGHSTSESEELLQLNQDSTINFYPTVMLSRFSGFD